jgi:hypothetical protein
MLAGGDAGFHAIRRRLAALLPESPPLGTAAPLELSGVFAQDAPRLDPPDLLEGKTLEARPPAGDPVVRFSAFLDGTQQSRVVQYVSGIPIVHGTVAAVVRERRDRRMQTWREPLVSRALYAPLGLLPTHVREAIEETGVEVFDTGAGRDLDSIHPYALQEAALQSVQRHRSALERELADAWVAADAGMLLVDGGISESPAVARSGSVVGVVKSHQQLYVHGDDLPTLLALRHAERSSVAKVAPRTRTPVASWYLRLRDANGRDPLWGLVRVEVALPDGSPRAVTSRADEVSRWVLAEALPVALPDARWDKMVYGVRDCEAYLRGIQ